MKRSNSRHEHAVCFDTRSAFQIFQDGGANVRRQGKADLTTCLSRNEHRTWINGRLRAIIKAAPRERRDALIEDLQRQVQRFCDIPQNAFARAAEVAATDGRLVELGGHTVSHPNLAACDHDARRDELETGKSRLEQIGGRPLEWFAYPFGGRDTFDDETAAAVADAGFKGAVTLLPGTVGAHSHAYMLPRLAVSPALSLADFKARVGGAPLFAWAERQRARLVQARS